jgi:hypothetical protein
MKLDKKLAEQFCKDLILAKGNCAKLYCTNCPGLKDYNDNISCGLKGWRINAYSSKCKQAVKSAKEWLSTNCKPLDNIYVEEE